MKTINFNRKLNLVALVAEVSSVTLEMSSCLWIYLLTVIIFRSFSFSAEVNEILQENRIVGNSSWFNPQGSMINFNDVEGFTTKMGYAPGEEVSFKLKSQLSYSAAALIIYRLGYYIGNGAREVGRTHISGLNSHVLCRFDPTYRMTDCGNWQVSANFLLPKNLVSGVFVAVPETSSPVNGTQVGAYIPFIVRQHMENIGADILFKTADLTWVAYNKYGGWNLYKGNGSNHFSSRAYKASYNRPLINRKLYPYGQFENFLFGAEFAMIHWLETQGYSVAYASCSDFEALHRASMLDRYRLILSVGHDEYWTQGIREAHESARSRGVHLAFFSGNEAFWRVEWDGDAADQRKLRAAANAITEVGQQRVVLCYKETHDYLAQGGDAKTYANPARTHLKHASVWTGTFRDPRQPVASIAAENSLTGQYFMVNGFRADSFSVRMEDSLMRFWQHAVSFKRKPLGTVVYQSQPGLLGYEWDAFVDDCNRPDGLIGLSFSKVEIRNKLLQEYGAAYNGSGNVTHRLTLYRHMLATPEEAAQSDKMREMIRSRDNSTAWPMHCNDYNTMRAADHRKSAVMELDPARNTSLVRSALVFGAGTTQWSWGLSSWHDGPVLPEDTVIQQATLNLFADMGVLPDRASFQARSHESLVYPMQSTDTLPPRSHITSALLPHRGKAVHLFNATVLRIRGIAKDFGGGKVAGVEVSVNGGKTWHMAVGREIWQYTFSFKPEPHEFGAHDCSAIPPPKEEATAYYHPSPLVRRHRDELIRSDQLFDENRKYDGGVEGRQVKMVILSRAVDDSGWIEAINYDAIFCNLDKPWFRHVEHQLNSALISLDIQ